MLNITYCFLYVLYQKIVLNLYTEWHYSAYVESAFYVENTHNMFYKLNRKICSDKIYYDAQNFCSVTVGDLFFFFFLICTPEIWAVSLK